MTPSSRQALVLVWLFLTGLAVLVEFVSACRFVFWGGEAVCFLFCLILPWLWFVVTEDIIAAVAKMEIEA